MRANPLVAAGIAAALFTTPALAHEYELGGLSIGHPYAIASTGKTAAGYLSVSNAGPDADRLIAIETEFPRAEVHRTEKGANGVMRMSPVGELEIPAGETVSLEPGGLHIMLMGLERPLSEGENVAATLVFESAGEIPVNFQVEARNNSEAADGAESMPGMSH